MNFVAFGVAIVVDCSLTSALVAILYSRRTAFKRCRLHSKLSVAPSSDEAPQDEFYAEVPRIVCDHREYVFTMCSLHRLYILTVSLISLSSHTAVMTT